MYDSPIRTLHRAPKLSDTVAEDLTEAILSRRLPHGARLPSERELGERFGVSRTVIREAVRSLAARGLVRVTSGRGVEVTRLDGDLVSQSMKLYIRGQERFDYTLVQEVRLALEVQTAGLAAERADESQVHRLAELCEAMEDALPKGKWKTIGRLDFEFHRTLTEATHNELFVLMLDSISDVLQEVREQAMQHPGVAEVGLAAHRDILRRVAEHDAAAARQSMLSHLRDAEAVWRRIYAATTARDDNSGNLAPESEIAEQPVDSMDEPREG